MTEERDKGLNETESSEKEEYIVDFTTSSAISRVNIKFLAVYLPIFWCSGLLVSIMWYDYFRGVNNWLVAMLLLPIQFIFTYFTFLLACLFFSKLFLILVNLIHKPKEGVFKAEIGNTDFEFWCLRTELKKLALWLLRNCPLPWIDSLAFRWFGVKMDFSSHLQDSWCDAEFIKMGRKVLVGQGAVLMSSMVIGKYLIIKRITFEDYALIGGQTTIAPGTHFGKDTVLGAVCVTTYNQFLEDGWIYTGIPARKFKPNIIAESKRDLISTIDVDEEHRVEVEHKVNIDEDKKHLLKPRKEG